ncbi:MAG: hypothetical protein EXR72_07550 [Myxococcales bacterium]|nr:hypothetical protein [Myxococcales bacterium]
MTPRADQGDGQRGLLHRHGDAYRERNEFLYLALGLLSGSRRLARLLVDHGGKAAPDAPRTEKPPDPRALHLLLGLISFSRTLSRHLAGNSRRAASSESNETSPGTHADPKGGPPATVARPRDLLL